MGLLKTIFFIIFFYYAFKFISKLLAPFLMKKMAQTMQQRAEQQFRGSSPYKNDIREGETVIDKKPSQHQESKKTVGEYVDFEEID